MLSVFIHFRNVGVAFFGIKTSTRSKKLPKHGDRIGLHSFCLFFRQRDRAPNDFRL